MNAEQTAIAEVLSEMDAELEALERRREKTRALKRAMMQQLLTGQTRLVCAPANAHPRSAGLPPGPFLRHHVSAAQLNPKRSNAA
jgi:hypothetical protein